MKYLSALHLLHPMSLYLKMENNSHWKITRKFPFCFTAVIWICYKFKLFKAIRIYIFDKNH